MKTKTNKPTVIFLAVIGGLYMSSTMAHEDGAADANVGYLGDTRGHVVTDSSGNCIRTSSWTPELAIPFCEPGMMKKAPEPMPVAAPAPAPEPVPEPVYQEISLRAGALFDTNKAELKPEGRMQLDALASKLKSVSRVDQIDVVGHTDSRGSEAYNQALSERRADAVKAYLVEQGIAGNTITSSGRGESDPVASNDTASGRANNRRVEIGIRATQRVK
jgi:OOP family OmpA-OmpF porin